MEPYNQGFFNSIAPDFDEHVSNSIPLFKEVQRNIADNITSVYDSSTVLDVCGSTGALGRVLSQRGWLGSYTCLDGSKEMQEVFNTYPAHPCLNFELAGFMQGWDDIPTFKPTMKYDIAVECLGFQFFSKGRVQELRELKRLSKMCVIFEKFSTDADVFQANEELKEPYKRRSFTEEELTEKKRTVLDQMGDYLYDASEFDSLIRAEFRYVSVIARIGNFVGYIATDDAALFDAWEVDYTLLHNKYTVSPIVHMDYTALEKIALRLCAKAPSFMVYGEAVTGLLDPGVPTGRFETKPNIQHI